MEPTPTLQSVLTDIVSRNAGEQVEIEFGEQASIAPDGTIYLPYDSRDVLGNGDGEKEIDHNTMDEFRIVRDSGAHEAHHKRLSDLSQMEAFAQRYPEAPSLATTVLNVVEDVFIDIYRLNRYPGQRIEYTFKIQKWFENRRDEFPDNPTPEDLGNGIIEVGKSGGVVGIEACSNEDILNFFEWAKDMFEIVRYDAIATYNDEQENHKQLRWDIASTIMDRLIEVLGNEENVNQANENVENPFPEHGKIEMMGFGMPDEPNPDGMDMDTAGSIQVVVSPEDAVDQANEDPDGDIEFDAVIEQPDDPWRDDSGNEDDDAESGGMADDSGEGGVGDEDGDTAAGTDSIDPDGEKNDVSGSSIGEGDAKHESEGDAEDGGNGGSEDEDVEGDGDQSDTDADSSGSGSTDSDEDANADGTAQQADERAENLKPDFSDWVNMASSVDATSASGRVENEYRRVVENSEGNFDGLDKSKQKRDKRLQNSNGEAVEKQIMEEWGEKIEEAFSIFKTRDREHATMRGEEPHIDNYIDHRAGNKTITKFMKTRLPTEPGERLNVACVDMSGSIDETMVKTALGAYQYATEIIGDDFAAVAFSAEDDKVQTPLITSPDEPFDWGHINTVSSGGGTPTEAGIDRATQLIEEYGKRENVMLVITDGKPNKIRSSVAVKTKAGSTEVAHQRVRDAQQYAKAIGVGVGNVNESQMKQMFGNDYVMINERNLAKRLVEIYRDQMNVDDTTHIA